MKCSDASALISAYLDRELTQADEQRMRLHLEECGDCSKTCKELRLLKSRMGELSYPDTDTAMLQLLERDTISVLGKWSGWLLLLIPTLILAAFTVYEVFTESGEPLLARVIYAAFALGMLTLFITVLRQRLISYKSDKYRNVKL